MTQKITTEAEKDSLVLLAMWCGLTCFVSPIWLTLIYLYLTGLVYKYDWSMDEGTAGILGVILLILWIIFAFCPNLVLFRKIYLKNKKHIGIYLIFCIALCIVCAGLCGWDMIRFLTIPGGLKSIR